MWKPRQAFVVGRGKCLALSEGSETWLGNEFLWDPTELTVMYLREIGVALFRPGYDREIYLREAEHVADIFIQFLPRKFVLDGMAKTNITLGCIEGKPRYSRLNDVNQYCFQEFDFAGYDLASSEEKDELVLGAIECSLLDIAENHGADSIPIRAAAEATRKCKFDLKGYTKLSRFTKSRKLHLKVFQRLSRHGIGWGIDVATAKGQVLETVWITDKTDSWRSAHAFRKSHWDGDRFVIVDFLGKPSYTLNAGPLERRLLSGGT